uniref:Uncharacterized protein n=1 Tax=Arundo donax TaxID=35708 RepID=A0A0A9FLR6_ARUDO
MQYVSSVRNCNLKGQFSLLPN